MYRGTGSVSGVVAIKFKNLALNSLCVFIFRTPKAEGGMSHFCGSFFLFLFLFHPCCVQALSSQTGCKVPRSLLESPLLLEVVS